MSVNTVSVRRRVLIPLRGVKSEVEFITFSQFEDEKEHFAIKIKGREISRIPLIRIHSECATGDIFGSLRCDCGDQLEEAIQIMDRIGGFIIYLRQEGRGIGFNSKIDAYNLQDQGFDTFEANIELGFAADLRDYRVAAQILQALKIYKVKLKTNNPQKVEALEHAGVVVSKRVPTGVYLSTINCKYLKTKVAKANHKIDLNSTNRIGRSI